MSTYASLLAGLLSSSKIFTFQPRLEPWMNVGLKKMKGTITLTCWDLVKFPNSLDEKAMIFISI